MACSRGRDRVLGSNASKGLVENARGPTRPEHLRAAAFSQAFGLVLHNLDEVFSAGGEEHLFRQQNQVDERTKGSETSSRPTEARQDQEGGLQGGRFFSRAKEGHCLHRRCSTAPTRGPNSGEVPVALGRAGKEGGW